MAIAPPRVFLRRRPPAAEPDAIHARERDESGFTLVEAVASIGVVGVLLLPMAGIFYTGQSTNAGNRAYGDAVALADSALSDANAINYSNLFFYPSQFQGVSCPSNNVYSGPALGGYGTQVGVIASYCNAPTNFTPIIQPQSPPYRVGNVSFTLKTYIVWADGSGGSSQAYKQVYAAVTWSEGGQPVSTTQSILVYPGGLGKYSGAQGSQSASTPTTPPSVSGLDVPCSHPTSNCPQDNLTVSWTDPGSPEPGWYEIVMATNATSGDLPPSGESYPLGVGVPYNGWNPTGTTAMGSASAPATNFTVTGLSPGTQYCFAVVAFSSDGTQWTVSAASQSPAQSCATTAAATPQVCQLTSLTVSQTGQLQIDSVTVKNGNSSTAGHLSNPVSVTVAYTGTCTVNDTAIVSVSGPSALGPLTLTFSASPNQFTYNPPTGYCPGTSTSTKFATGQYAFSVTLDGANQTPTANVSFTSTGGTPQC